MRGSEEIALSLEKVQEDRKVTFILFSQAMLTVRRMHTLTAEELQTAHLIPYLQTAEQELNTKLKATQKENETLMQNIVAQRAEIEKLVLGLEAVVQDLEGSVAVMGAGMGKGVDGLRADIWEMEQEMKAVS